MGGWARRLQGETVIRGTGRGIETATRGGRLRQRGLESRPASGLRSSSRLGSGHDRDRGPRRETSRGALCRRVYRRAARRRHKGTRGGLGGGGSCFHRRKGPPALPGVQRTGCEPSPWGYDARKGPPFPALPGAQTPAEVGLGRASLPRGRVAPGGCRGPGAPSVAPWTGPRQEGRAPGGVAPGGRRGGPPSTESTRPAARPARPRLSAPRILLTAWLSTGQAAADVTATVNPP